MAVTAAFVWGSDRVPFVDPDEGRYAEVAREMLDSADWIVPRLYGVTYLEKPPLLYWLAVGAFHLFGLSELAARIVPALSGCDRRRRDRLRRRRNLRHGGWHSRSHDLVDQPSLFHVGAHARYRRPVHVRAHDRAVRLSAGRGAQDRPRARIHRLLAGPRARDVGQGSGRQFFSPGSRSAPMRFGSDRRDGFSTASFGLSALCFSCSSCRGSGSRSWPSPTSCRST